ncbi:MAG: molybdopterin cofactor-binding domain-containing protein [Caulobacteraceae bacterium]
MGRPAHRARCSRPTSTQIYIDGLDGKMASARKDGDVEAGLAKPGGKLVEAVYEAPYQAHAALEPLNATVWLQKDRLDIWVSTQSPGRPGGRDRSGQDLRPRQLRRRRLRPARQP